MEPMTIAEYIQVACLTYPTLFHDPYMDGSLWAVARRSVLSHMYLTLGNGMEWQEGRLLPWGPLSNMEKMALKAIRYKTKKKRDQKILEVRQAVAKDYHMGHPKLYKMEDSGLINFNLHEREYRQMLAQNLEKMGSFSMATFNPYPFTGPNYPHKCGQLFEIPDNVEPEFLAGIFEIMNDVINLPIKAVDGNEKKLKQNAQEWIDYLTSRFYEANRVYILCDQDLTHSNCDLG